MGLKLEFHMRLYQASLLALVFAASAPAHAQAAPEDGPDTLQPQLAGDRSMMKRDLRGLRVAKPGALAFASYDSDGSLDLTTEEIAAGAARSFKAADIDGDGLMSIFEQQDWAADVGAHDGALANAMTFDANLDRSVSVEEFTDGMLRLSRAYAAPDGGALYLSDLLEAPAGADRPPRDKAELTRRDRPPLDERSGATRSR